MDQIVINQNENQEILINSNEPQVITLNNLTVQDIEINTNENQDLSISQPDNQVILIDGGGNIVGITDVLVNGVSVVSGNIAYVIVPTKTSELTNDSGFLTSETDPTVPSYVKAISLADINNWNNKQNELVSGSTIKTINNTSLLGSGNIEIDGTVYTAGTGIDITNNEISNTITSYDDLTDLPTIPEKVSDLINDLDYVRENELAEVAFTGGYGSLSNTPEYLSDFINDTNYVDTTDLSTALADKQDTLVSGTNIKTINNNSILGSGNLTISGGSATDVQINSTSITSGGVANIETKSNYNSSTNKIITENEITNMAVTNANNNFSAKQTFNNGTELNGGCTINTSVVINSSNKSINIGPASSSYCNYTTDATRGHYFNKSLYVNGDIYGSTSYNQKVAYESYVDNAISNQVNWSNTWLYFTRVPGGNWMCMIPLNNPTKTTPTLTLTSSDGFISSAWTSVNISILNFTETYVMLTLSSSSTNWAMLVRLTGGLHL